MDRFWLYSLLSKSRRLSYRAKIMLVAFAGTHIPLLALIAFFCLKTAPNWSVILWTLGVALVATLLGTGLTLLILDQLLRPLLATARTLRAYRSGEPTKPLPTHYTDEVGALMADAAATLSHLEGVLNTLEFVDAGSGLPNRKRLERDLQARLTPGMQLLVCAIRFGGYRQLSEAVDQPTAEAAVGEIGRRLRAHFANEGLYRVNDESFVALRTETSAGALETSEVSARLIRDLAECRYDVAVGGLSIAPAFQVGVAAHPEDATTPAALVDRALGAMGSSEAMVNFHSAEGRRAALGRLQLEQELRRALEREEFVLHYQPLMDLNRGRAFGVEALIRWRHPEHGLLPPARFIRMAESMGLTEPLGLWVMRQACRQIHQWNALGLADIKVAINLSARQFLDPDLTRFVHESLTAAGASPSQLEIELTETVATVDEDHTRSTFGALHDLGVTIAIDDFGSGYASMSQLRRLPFDKLKIDREFVTKVQERRDSQAICDAIITLGKGLGLRVLAEGAETEPEIRFLNDLGCNLFQGYYFARPMPPEDLIPSLSGLSSAAMALTAPARSRVHDLSAQTANA